METKETQKKKVKKLKFKKLNILGLISFIIYVIFCIIFARLDLLSPLYLTLVIVILLLIQILGIFLINRRKKGLKILGSIILILFTIIHCVGIYYCYNTNEFLNKSLGSKYIKNTNTYYIVSKASNNLTEDDIAGDISYFKNTPNIDKANNKLKTIYTDAVMKSYEDVNLMFKDLNNDVVKFMYIEQSSFNTIFDLDKELNKDNYKVLDKIEVTSKLKAKDSNDSIFNIYVSGTDFTEENLDFNMIITVNTETNRILLTSIPRDYYFELDGYNGSKDKLSFMKPYGIETISNSLENLLNIDIDYYFKINTTGLVTVINEIGGINFCSDYDYITTHALVMGTYDDTKGKKLHVTKGCQYINGIEALTIARERKKLQGGDRARQENCRKIFMAILNKLNNVNTVTNYTGILDSFNGLYETSLPKSAFSNIAKTTINNKGKWKIEEQSVDGQDGKDYIKLTKYTDWVMYPDMQTVEKAGKKINRIINH